MEPAIPIALEKKNVKFRAWFHGPTIPTDQGGRRGFPSAMRHIPYRPEGGVRLCFKKLWEIRKELWESYGRLSPFWFFSGFDFFCGGVCHCVIRFLGKCLILSRVVSDCLENLAKLNEKRKN